MSMSPRRANWFQHFSSDLWAEMHRELQPQIPCESQEWSERLIQYVRIEARFLADHSHLAGPVDRQWFLQKRIMLNVAGTVHQIPMQFATDFVRDVHWIPDYSGNGLSDAKWVESKPAPLFEPLPIRPGELLHVKIHPGSHRPVHVDVLLGGTCIL